MNICQILTTIFGVGACAALAWGGAQISAWPLGSAAALAGMIGLWAAAGVLGFVYLRAANSEGWMTAAFVLALFVGAAAMAIRADHFALLRFAPAMTQAACVIFSLEVSERRSSAAAWDNHS
jgi:hypothetical protein